MKTRNLIVAGIATLFIGQHAAISQEGDMLRIRRLEAETVRAPQYQVRAGQAPRRQREWLQIRTEFQTAPDWIDEMTFTYYVVLRNRRPAEGEPEHRLFRGESSYINIARTRDGQSTVFLHPSTLERFGEVVQTGVVVTSGGRMIAMESSPSREGRWWEQLTPQSGMVLNRRDTPFAMVNFDDFEAIPASAR